MYTGKQKQMNASYQTSLVKRHIRRFTGLLVSTPWLNSVKLKGVSSRLYNKTYRHWRQMIHQDHYRLHNTIHILLKTRSLFYSFCSSCLFCLRSTNAIKRRHWLLASVSTASVLSEHHLFVYVRHIWSTIFWGAPSSRKQGIKRLLHQKYIQYFVYIIPHGADKWFPWDRGCCWVSARDEVEGGNSNNNRGPMEIISA